jgi:hypothetical protein
VFICLGVVDIDMIVDFLFISHYSKVCDRSVYCCCYCLFRWSYNVYFQLKLWVQTGGDVCVIKLR